MCPAFSSCDKPLHFIRHWKFHARTAWMLQHRHQWVKGPTGRKKRNRSAFNQWIRWFSRFGPSVHHSTCKKRRMEEISRRLLEESIFQWIRFGSGFPPSTFLRSSVLLFAKVVCAFTYTQFSSRNRLNFGDILLTFKVPWSLQRLRNIANYSLNRWKTKEVAVLQ